MKLIRQVAANLVAVSINTDQGYCVQTLLFHGEACRSQNQSFEGLTTADR